MKKYKDLWLEKNYIKVMLANIITRLGDGIDTIAFSWLVYEVTGSTVLTASIFGVNVIPNLTIGLVSGVICQYVSEKLMMFVCDLGRALCVFLIAFLYMSGHLAVWHLFVITFLNSSFEAFRTPVEASIYPKILSKDHLDLGIALKESFVNGANFLGIIIAPICITLWGLHGALIIDALSFALCGLIILTMQNIHVTTEDKMTLSKCFQDLKDGFAYVKKDRFLVKLLIIFCLTNALFTPINSFEAAFVKDVLHMGSIGISLFSMGFLLGNVLFSPMLPFLKEKFLGRKLIVYGTMVVGITMIGYSLLPNVPSEFRYIALTLVAFFMGGAIGTLNYPVHLALYKRIEPTYLSRVQSICGTCAMAIVPISSFLAGGISAFVPLQMIYLSCAILLFICSIYIFFQKLFYVFNQT